MPLKRLTDLRELFPGTPDATVDVAIERWNKFAALALNAERADIRLRDADLSPNDPRVPADARTLAIPIRVGGRTVGIVAMSGPLGRPLFDLDDREMGELLGLLIGQSIEIAQLRAVLDSRFTQLALAGATESALGPALPEMVSDPPKVARILGRAFYRELARAGFGVNQIIHAATEVIGQVSSSLDKHRQRQQRHAV